MSTIAQTTDTRHPGLGGPSFTLLAPRRASRLPILIAVLAAALGLLADRLGPTGTARDAARTADIIAGRVLDAQGEPLAGATVSFAGGSSSSAVQTDTTGQFASPPMHPGTYSVRAELLGFEPSVPRRISVPSERPTGLTMALDLAALPAR